MANAVIGCKLPNGIVLDIEGVRVEVPGKNSSTIKDAAGRGISDGQKTVTEVDAEQVKAFFDHHEKTFKPIQSGAIYLASSESDAKRKAEQTQDKKTGQEPVNPDKPVEGAKKDG